MSAGEKQECMWMWRIKVLLAGALTTGMQQVLRTVRRIVSLARILIAAQSGPPAREAGGGRGDAGAQSISNSAHAARSPNDKRDTALYTLIHNPTRAKEPGETPSACMSPRLPRRAAPWVRVPAALGSSHTAHRPARTGPEAASSSCRANVIFQQFPSASGTFWAARLLPRRCTCTSHAHCRRLSLPPAPSIRACTPTWLRSNLLLSVRNTSAVYIKQCSADAGRRRLACPSQPLRTQIIISHHHHLISQPSARRNPQS